MGGLLTEIVNIFIIVQSDNIGDVIKDFIAFQIIATIDDIMGKTLNIDKFDLEKDIEAAKTGKEGLKQPKNSRMSFKEEFDLLKKVYENKNGLSFNLFILAINIVMHNIMENLYEIIYYYFVPFFVILITFFHKDDASHTKNGEEHNFIYNSTFPEFYTSVLNNVMVSNMTGLP